MLRRRQRRCVWSPTTRAITRRSGPAITAISQRLEMTPETLHRWVRQAQLDAGQRSGASTELAREIRELYVIDGATHVDLYDRDEYVSIAAAKLTEFFNNTWPREARRKVGRQASWIARRRTSVVASWPEAGCRAGTRSPTAPLQARGRSRLEGVPGPAAEKPSGNG